MRALVFDNRLTFDDSHCEPKPAEGECVVRVRMAGICATDIQITRGYMRFRGILGHEMVGTVAGGWPEMTNRRVVCEINCVCGRCDLCQSGLSSHCRNRTVMGISGRDGCFADGVAVPRRNLHAVPDVISDEEAVFVEPLAAAIQVTKQVPIGSGMAVAVVGSGRLGLLVTQVLALTGCRLELIGRNPHTLQFAEKHGVQSTRVDVASFKNDRDVVVECTGSAEGLAIALGLVRPRGTIVLKSTYAEPAGIDLAPAVVNEVTILGSRCGPFKDAIDNLAARKIEVASMIARTYKIERGLEAFEAIHAEHAIKVLLRINT